ncbi:hypothetical protein L1987_37530 [Smallanthus sonchifolius]|uniref:Uncharacterized protein n=1 Tax=Smallanthus sonchifolius TaxID=185202 RepID=A0ACB9HG70_9ASTR|nr:hypothetical protein L1987_37530 [Smallanthus sonchifolius]
MSKQTGPSQNTRGKKKHAVMDNAAENNEPRKELQKIITEGIKDSLPMIFTELEKRQADRIYVQPSVPQSIHYRQTRTVTQSKPVTLEPKGSYLTNLRRSKEKNITITLLKMRDCKPFNFSRKEGGIATLRWIAKTECLGYQQVCRGRQCFIRLQFIQGSSLRMVEQDCYC